MITFGRAGEDNKKFKLGDVEQTLAGFAGADYDLQARALHAALCNSIRVSMRRCGSLAGQEHACDIATSYDLQARALHAALCIRKPTAFYVHLSDPLGCCFILHYPDNVCMQRFGPLTDD